MLSSLRWVVMAAVNVLAIFLLQQFNELVAPLSLYLVLVGPLLVVPVFYLNFRGSVACALVTGLCWGAGDPVGVGFAVPGFLVFNLLLYWQVGRFRRERLMDRFVFAAMANGLWIVALAMRYAWWDGTYWGRVFIDGVVSEIVVLAVMAWLHALQRSVLQLSRLGLSTS